VLADNANTVDYNDVNCYKKCIDNGKKANEVFLFGLTEGQVFLSFKQESFFYYNLCNYAEESVIVEVMLQVAHQLAQS
jgi:hypothetical protein